MSADIVATTIRQVNSYVICGYEERTVVGTQFYTHHWSTFIRLT